VSALIRIFKRQRAGRAGALSAEAGAFLIEFAFVMPIVLFLIFAGFEMARYIRTYQVTHKVAYELARGMLQCINPSGPTSEYAAEQRARTRECFNAYLRNYGDMASDFLETKPVVINARIFNDRGNEIYSRGFGIRIDTEKGGPGCDGLTVEHEEATLESFCDIGPSLRGEKFFGQKPRNLRNWEDVIGVSNEVTNIAVFTQVTVPHDSIVERILNFRILAADNSGDVSINHVSATALVY